MKVCPSFISYSVKMWLSSYFSSTSEIPIREKELSEEERLQECEWKTLSQIEDSILIQYYTDQEGSEGNPAHPCAIQFYKFADSSRTPPCPQ